MSLLGLGKSREPAAPQPDLRGELLRMAPPPIAKLLAPKKRRIWAILMEQGYDKATATLALVVDGTTSLYFSNGGGILGAGVHAPVKAQVGSFFIDAERLIGQFTPATETPLPEMGRVRFYLRLDDGSTLTAEGSVPELGELKHPVSHLFHRGHATIAAIRQATEKT